MVNHKRSSQKKRPVPPLKDLYQVDSSKTLPATDRTLTFKHECNLFEEVDF